MSEFKEVWYLVNKIKTEIKGASRYYLSNGWTIDADDKLVNYVIDERFSTTINAYTLGQKRRRLKCVCEDGMLYMPSVAGGYYEPHPCPRCNGTGFIKGEWEYQEC